MKLRFFFLLISLSAQVYADSVKFTYSTYKGDSINSILSDFMKEGMKPSKKLIESVKKGNSGVTKWKNMRRGVSVRISIPNRLANDKKIQKYINIQRAKRYYQAMKRGGDNFLQQKGDRARILKTRKGNPTSVKINIKKELEYKIKKKNLYIAPIYKYGLKAMTEDLGTTSTKVNDYFLFGAGLQVDYFQHISKTKKLEHYAHIEFSNTPELSTFGVQKDFNALYKARYLNFWKIFKLLGAFQYDKTHNLGSDGTNSFVRATSSIFLGGGVMGNLKIDIFEVLIETIFLMNLSSSSELTGASTTTATDVSGNKFMLTGELIMLDQYFIRGAMSVHNMSGDSEVALLKTEASLGYKFSF